MLAEREAGGHDRWLDALMDQASAFSDEALIDWYGRHHPEVDRLWVQGRITADTVNDPGRRHLPHPRDLLFRRRDGLLERYVPTRHGAWSASGVPVLVPMPGSAPDRFRDEQNSERVWFARRAG